MGRRRGNAEGSYYRRSDGRWAGAISLGGGKRKEVYGRTLKEVREKLKAVRRALDDGLPVSSGRQKVGAYIERWLCEVAEPTVRLSTYRRYRQLLLGHVSPSLGAVALAKLSPEDLQGLYSAKLKAGLAPRTVGHIHRVLHRALRDALRWGLVARNVGDAVSPPKVPHQEMQVLDLDQSKHLLAAVEDDPLEALYVLAVTTGLRQGELLALKWRDFDPGTTRLVVKRTVRYVSGEGSVEGEPKSARSRRSIELTPMAVSVLNRHKSRQAEHRLKVIAWEDHDLIFPNEVGRHIEASNLVRRSFKPLLARADLPPIRFHDLRHTAATLMLLKGVNFKAVSEILGHSSTSFTLDVYCHFLPSMQADAAARMEAMFTEDRAAI